MKKVVLTTFPRHHEFIRAKDVLDSLSLPYRIIMPEGRYKLVGVSALMITDETCSTLLAESSADLLFSGWVEYRPSRLRIPSEEPEAFEEDIFGDAAIMVLAPCIADKTKIRLVAHISGDLGKVFPYLNAEMKAAIFNANAPYLTFKDGYRNISLFTKRIGLAKIDDIVDAWRVLEMTRCLVNEVWMRRKEIEPSYQIRKNTTALEIYKHLPRTNCGECGQKGCFAFAVFLFTGSAELTQCRPVFSGEYIYLQDELLEICAGF